MKWCDVGKAVENHAPDGDTDDDDDDDDDALVPSYIRARQFLKIYGQTYRIYYYLVKGWRAEARKCVHDLRDALGFQLDIRRRELKDHHYGADFLNAICDAVWIRYAERSRTLERRKGSIRQQDETNTPDVKHTDDEDDWDSCVDNADEPRQKRVKLKA